MSIQIKKQKTKPSIPVMEVNCDNKLNDRLDKFELSKNLNKHSCNLVIGRPGSGKSSLLWGLFKSKDLLKKIFHKVIYFAPEASQKSVKNNIFSTLPDSQRFDELTLTNLEDALAQIKSVDSDENVCLILDDQTAYLKNKETLKLFKELLFNKRHLHCSVFFLVQTYYSVPKDLRRVFDNVFIFKTSKDELQNVFDELVEQHKDYVLPISKLVYNEPHKYMMINLNNQRIFNGFDCEILINDEI
jgi:KaiC/GvpD/RAD55 family RecA-like ATPase